MDRPARPRPTQVSLDTTFVQLCRDLALGFPSLYKHSVYPTDRLHFLFGPWRQYDPICLNGLLFSARKFGFGKLGLIDQLPAQSVSGRATLPKPVFDKTALARENLGR